MQLTVRVAAERTLADSPFGHFLQAVQVFVYRLLHHIALRSQKEVEVIVERFVETSERNVFLPVFLLYERSQVVVGVLVAGIGLFHPIYADPFVKLCIVFPEQGQQRERLLAYAFYGVLYQFCRDEAEVVAICSVSRSMARFTLRALALRPSARPVSGFHSDGSMADLIPI